MSEPAGTIMALQAHARQRGADGSHQDPRGGRAAADWALSPVRSVCRNLGCLRNPGSCLYEIDGLCVQAMLASAPSEDTTPHCLIKSVHAHQGNRIALRQHATERSVFSCSERSTLFSVGVQHLDLKLQAEACVLDQNRCTDSAWHCSYVQAGAKATPAN